MRAIAFRVHDQEATHRPDSRGTRASGKPDPCTGAGDGRAGLFGRVEDRQVRPATGRGCAGRSARARSRSEEHTSELQSLMRISYAVFCLKKKKKNTQNNK